MVVNSYNLEALYIRYYSNCLSDDDDEDDDDDDDNY